MKIGVIFACDGQGGIGINNEMPWHFPEDFKQFRRVTMGKPMIMGRKTFDSLPGMLAGREHMVITSSPDSLPDHEMVYCARDLADAIDQYTCGSGDDVEMVWIIGGKRVIEEAVKVADVVRLTKVLGTYETDVKIDEETLLYIHKQCAYSEEVIRDSGFSVYEFHMKEKPSSNSGMLLN